MRFFSLFLLVFMAYSVCYGQKIDGYSHFNVTALEHNPIIENNLITSHYFEDYFSMYDIINHKVVSWYYDGKIKEQISFPIESDYPSKYLYDPIYELHYVANLETEKIILFDCSGNVKNTYDTPTLFTDWKILGKNDGIVFYSPMPVYNKGNALIITDMNFNILRVGFSEHTLVGKFNQLSLARLVSNNGKVYFNPPRTTDIYNITIDEDKLIYTNSNIMPVNGTENPYRKFFPTSKHLLLLTINDKKTYEYLLVDIHDNHLVGKHNSVISHDPFKEFDVSFSLPTGVCGDNFYTTGPIDLLKNIVNQIKENNPAAKISPSVSNIINSTKTNYLLEFSY